MDQSTNDVWSKETDALSSAELVLIAKEMIAARQALHGPLPSDLLHDPALDLLLCAYVADVEGRLLGNGGLIAATTVAMPVARRWTAVLVSRDLLGEQNSEVFLTPNGRTVVEEMLRAVSRSQAAI